MRFLPAFVLVLCSAATVSAAETLTQEQMVAMLKHIDDMSMNPGDYKALVNMEATRADGNNFVRQIIVHRRDLDDAMVLLFAKPKSEAGKGFLRLDRNLWFYEPRIGKWTRSSERLGIGGSDARRRDFDDNRYSTEFVPSFVGEERLGKIDTYHLQLRAKPDIEVAFPIEDLWIHKTNKVVLKRESRAESGRLMLTTYYLKWKNVKTPSKKEPLEVAEEIRVLDDVQKGNSTILQIRKIDLSPLEKNLFTKAWLESKTR